MINTSPLDGYRNQIEDWIRDGKSNRQIALLVEDTYDTPTSERSVRRAIRRWDLKKEPRAQFDRPGFRVNGDDAEITSDPRAWKDYLNDTDALLTERGLDPADWEIQSLTVNEWDSPTGETLKQLKVHLKRRKTFEMIVPARVSLGKVWPKVNHIITDLEPELVVFVGDFHAPYHDPELHKHFLDFLHFQEPERIILMGDIIDLGNISRHPDEPEWRSSTQECVDTGTQIIVDIREADPTAEILKLPGNHLDRLRRAIIDRLADLYGLTPGKVEGLPNLPPIHDPAHLLRLDELNVQYVRAPGGYKHAQYMVTPYLAAKHGDVARRGSGASALAVLAGLDHSLIMGHTHRQSLVQKTVQQIDGTGRLLQAVETGCMCLIQGGLGYAPGPDWSNGFCTAAVWPDGTFKLDLATYVDNRLYWRSERY